MAYWTLKEKLICVGWLLLATVALGYGLSADIPPLSAEFFSMLAVIALLIGLAFTPSFLLRPLKESIGENMPRPLRLGFGCFCVLQLMAVGLKLSIG